MTSVNGERLTERIHTLGAVGKDQNGERTRLAASDADKLGRDLVVKWMKETGLKVVVDRIGNIFGIWETEKNKEEKPLMIGSHIDTVINAGHDGIFGVRRRTFHQRSASDGRNGRDGTRGRTKKDRL